MTETSVVELARRQATSRRGRCALVALVLILAFVAVGNALAQSPNGAVPPPVPPPPSHGEPSSEVSDDLDAALQRRGDLNLHGLSLNAALFMISEQWHINIVAGNVEGTVNGVFKQAPLREILDSILLSNGYNYRVVGRSLVVSSVEDLGQVNPFFQSATIPVGSADIDEVVEVAKLISTPQGQVRPMKSTRSIIVLDFPDRVKMIREFVAALDKDSGSQFATPGSRDGIPLEVGHYRTHYITARSAEPALATVLSKSGRVGVLEREDRLVVTDYAANLSMVEKLLEKIDRPRPQVRITALIYDISLQDIEQLGLKWNRLGYVSGNNSGVQMGIDPITTVPLGPDATTGATVAIGALSRHFDINAVAFALQSANDARLLADPNVAVLENEEAVFQSVSEIPYQQLTQTQQGGQIGTTAFKDAGISLRVRPRIAPDGTIEMQVEPEFSRLTGFTPGDNQPIIDRRTAATVLRIANRQTVVIGGLRQRAEVGDFSGIPYLKDVKVVGRLFRSRSTNVRESELVVFISPEIIDYADAPSYRQQMVADTVRCRLDQIPEAEGCPPCCRRLPPGAVMVDPVSGDWIQDGYPVEAVPAADAIPAEALPAPTMELPPMSAAEIAPAELQFGVVGRTDGVRAMVADGRLRRLPIVEADGAADMVSAHPSQVGTVFTPLPSSVRAAAQLPATQLR